MKRRLQIRDIEAAPLLGCNSRKAQHLGQFRGSLGAVNVAVGKTTFSWPHVVVDGAAVQVDHLDAALQHRQMAAQSDDLVVRVSDDQCNTVAATVERMGE
jgi:hypothetical protein